MAVQNEQILKLDVKQQQPNAIPRFVQYDSALLKIELYDNGKLYDVSRADNFVVSFKRPDGKMISGLAEYDGEFINYKMTKQDLEVLGEVSARLQIYEGRNRLSSLSFRYDVYEDYETVGDINDATLLSQLLIQVRDALADAQRQGGYAENRGDFANAAGDYANSAGDSQKMRWLKWVKTVAARNSTYKNPRNGDTVYVVNVADKNGGAVYRYNAVDRPHKWEEISGWDTSIIQDIYNLIDTKEDKTKVAALVKQLQEDLANTRFGSNNLIKQTDTSVSSNDVLYSPVTSNSEVFAVDTTDSGRVIQARLPANANQSYYGATVGNSSGRRFSVKEGETLTLSFLGTRSLTATDFTYVYLMRPSSEGSNKSMTLLQKHDVDSSGYDKYEFNVVAPWSSDNAYLLIGSNKRSEYGDDNAFWIRFKDVSFVRGNRAGDWSISLEDLVNNYKDLISDLEKDTSGKFTQHNSRIIQLEDKITMKVEETQYDNKMKEIGNWQSEYEQTARSITTTVSQKVGKNEIASVINQTAQSVKIDANKINLNGYVTISNIEGGSQKVHPNTMKDYGMTVINGGEIAVDSITLRRKDGRPNVESGELILGEFSAQRYEPAFTSMQPGNENNKVWDDNWGTYYSARLVDIYGKGGHSSWDDSKWSNHIDPRNSQLYTNIHAYNITEEARYLVVRYGVQTEETGVFVRLSAATSSGSNARATRTHAYRGDDTWGGEYNLVIDLFAEGSRWGKRRLFYLQATTSTNDLALGNSAERKAKVRILGVLVTDNPPVGNENLFVQ